MRRPLALTVTRSGPRTEHAAHNLALLRHFALNHIRLAHLKRKGGLKVQRPNAPNLTRRCHNLISKARNGLRAGAAPGMICIPLIRM
jgi:hypothetical protein